MKKDITEFIQTELNPRLYAHIPQIFPEHHFAKKGTRWQSGLHADGSKGTGKKEDRSVVTERYPTKVWDNTRQTATDVISLFMDRNGITEVWEAVNRLCSIVGIPQPEYTPEAKQRYLKAEQRRTALELSLERQKRALFAPEGKAALDYMHSRGWTDEEIKAAEIGYISAPEATTINAQRSVGATYQLSIPLRTGSTLYGFKFRTLLKELPEGVDKYTYLYGTNKKYNLYNLTGIQQGEGSIVVVEGELDALHAEVKGIKGVVATGGGKLTDELLQAATDRGIKHITLLFDNDKQKDKEKDKNKDGKDKDKEPAGARYVRQSIDIAHAKGISVLVATFPDGEYLDDGTPIHDVDEYLRKHSPEELQSLIAHSVSGSKYLLFDTIDRFQKKAAKKAEERGEPKDDPSQLTDEEELDLRNEVITLANQTPNEVERGIVFAEYAEMMCINGKQAFSPEALRAVADRERAQQNALKHAQETKKALKEATDLAEKGDPQAALQMMVEAARSLQRIDSRAKYGKLLALPTKEGLFQRLHDKQEELPTSYEFSRGDEKELFTIPTGAITFVCGPTSHGKSTLLQNLALQVAAGEGDGAVLYFTFEEDGDEVALQMANKYMDMELCRNYSSSKSNNMRALRHYFKTGSDRYISSAKRANFKQKMEEYLQKIYSSGKIRIYYEDYDSAELIEAIRTISSQTKVKAVFVDYIQLLYNRAYRKARLQRTEELKEICKDLKNLCVDTQLPIVVAAQLNREANSPLELHSQRIAEAADLERIANKVVCFWNTAFPAQKSKEGTSRAKELEALEQKHGFKLEQAPTFIYAKLTKNRSGAAGLEAVLRFNGNTGVIAGNYKPESPKPQDLPFEAVSEDSDSPF